MLFASLVILLPNLPLSILFGLLFLYGLANTGVATAYAVASEINPQSIAGTSVAFANMASVIIGAGFQPLIGWLLEKKWDGTMVDGLAFYSNANFRSSLLILLVSLLLAVLVACGIKETYCQRVA